MSVQDKLDVREVFGQPEEEVLDAFAAEREQTLLGAVDLARDDLVRHSVLVELTDLGQLLLTDRSGN